MPHLFSLADLCRCEVEYITLCEWMCLNHNCQCSQPCLWLLTDVLQQSSWISVLDHWLNFFPPGMTWPLDTINAFICNKTTGPWMLKCSWSLSTDLRAVVTVQHGDINWEKLWQLLMKFMCYAPHDVVKAGEIQTSLVTTRPPLFIESFNKCVWCDC